MHILLKKSKLKSIVQEAIKKAGSQRKFSKELGIPLSKAWSYQRYNIALTKERLDKILSYINQKIDKSCVEKELPDNWRQVMGGKSCVEKKIKEGRLNNQLAESRKKIKKTLKDWHKEMRAQNPKKYYEIQHAHFRQVAGHKLLTENGEKVRNILERDIANILKKFNIVYQYEPLIKSKGRFFFPDFLIKKNIILECTMWRGYDKAVKLKEKIEHLRLNYRIYVIIPPKLERYYKSIKDNLILGKDQFAELAKNLSK